MPYFDDAARALEWSSSMLIQERSNERAGTSDAETKRPRMDAVASSSGTAIACDRSSEGPLVILVGGAFQHRVIEAATAQLAVHVTVFRGGGDSGHRAPPAATPQLQGLGALVEPAASMVVVVVGSRSGVLAGAGPSSTRHEPVLVADDRRPPLPEGHVARLAEMVSTSAGR
jgi:hypothetical protein